MTPNIFGDGTCCEIVTVSGLSPLKDMQVHTDAIYDHVKSGDVLEPLAVAFEGPGLNALT